MNVHPSLASNGGADRTRLITFLRLCCAPEYVNTAGVFFVTAGSKDFGSKMAEAQRNIYKIIQPANLQAILLPKSLLPAVLLRS